MKRVCTLTVENSTVGQDEYIIESNVLQINGALNGLSLLLEELADKSRDQPHQLSWCHSILKLVIRQTEETFDLLTKPK